MRFAAVDLGASSGRVICATFGAGEVTLTEVHRFANRPVRVGGTLHWDILALWAGVLDGLRAAGRDGPLDGIGVDSWGVDYALLDADGTLLGNPVHYRDARTTGMPAAVAAVVPPAELFARTGAQPLPFSTVHQLAAARDSAALAHADRLLMIPDLIGYWLTGEAAGEVTNASTTGLLDVRTRGWATGLAARLGLRPESLPPLREPGTPLGPLRPTVAAECGLGRVPVFTVGSHDTASAVLGTPVTDAGRFAYVSSGTWSLAGTELTDPVTTPAAQSAGFGNELGVDGTVRFLRNVMGLWLLQECLRAWESAGLGVSLPALLGAAAALPARSVIDPDQPEFLPPGGMPDRIAAACRRAALPVPQTPAEFTRCVLDSLAHAHHRAIATAGELTGAPARVVHLTGGGARNTLLCQLTADACGLPVVAGPVEAAAWGNVLVQARAAGALSGGLADLRAVATGAVRTRVYQPRG